jgi:hypothetical protein
MLQMQYNCHIITSIASMSASCLSFVASSEYVFAHQSTNEVYRETNQTAARKHVMNAKEFCFMRGKCDCHSLNCFSHQRSMII